MSENTKTVTVYGYKRTDDITAIPFEYQSPVIDYAIAFAFWKDKRGQEAAQAWNRYVSSLTALKTGVIDDKLGADAWKDRNIPAASIGVRANG